MDEDIRSVPDLSRPRTAMAAWASAIQRFNSLQFTFNNRIQQLSPLLEALESTPAFPNVMCPFSMGAAVHEATQRAQAGVAAFRFLRSRMKRGIVLTGTGNPAHLAENIALFRRSATDSPDSSET